MQITNEIIESFSDCQFKSYLITKGVKGKLHDLEKFYTKRLNKLQNTYKGKFKGNIVNHKGNEISYEVLRKGYDCIFNVKLTAKEIDLKCDFLVKIDKSSKLGEFSYIPIICCKNEKNIPRKLKVLITGISNTLNTFQESHICNGKILYGNATIIPEMRAINQCSYFDYQKEKVFARTNKQLEQNIKRNKDKHKSHYLFKPDFTVEILPECPDCGNISTEQKKSLSKTIADLDFSNNGVRRNITLYKSGKYNCTECDNIFIPKKYKELTLRIGHNLIAWTIYQNIVQQIGFGRIETNLAELFDLYISRTTLFMCKQYFIDKYESTYKEIEKRVLSKGVLYVDETPFTMQFEKGYVWVFTNNEEVVSYYKSNREGGFLLELLKDYKGVLVTDFYQAYDKIKCPQQKCLIHLIRDMNADLVKNPFNIEFKKITKTFTDLIQKIVLTIDKHGLKRQYFEKYINKSEQFLDSIAEKEFKTEIVNHYKQRFTRYRKNLFEFLKHDSVSWHNGNAEHAIRLLAIHANKNMTVFKKTHINDYLKIFSIFQTCDFNNISFLKFMLSKEKSVYEYIKKADKIVYS